jgi:DNA mismatch repair protein MutS
MVGAERFFTEELKKFEEDILSASTKQKVLEQEMFHQLLQEIQEKTASIMEMAQIVGQMDALLSLSVLARGPGWVFPTIDESTVLEIHAGRHPLVDQAKKGEFVPNDVKLSPDTQLTLLITGPNMGGKSTLMRQVALIILLGQMGSPVPASAARWGVVSSLYTRIGAHDSIVRGKSTFMVEMSELAHILHHANERSLIVLDEIGRGTSTYDGISVAWSTLEWICNKIKARTLFATHYHELIHLAQTLPLLRNAHMAVEGGKVGKLSQLRFLYELRDGPTNESFGIHVAQLAGLPKPVVDRAWKILLQLETQNRGHSSNQLSLFSTPNSDGLDSEDLESASENPAIETLLQELENANINEMSPLQALNWIAKLQDLYQAPQQK